MLSSVTYSKLGTFVAKFVCGISCLCFANSPMHNIAMDTVWRNTCAVQPSLNTEHKKWFTFGSCGPARQSRWRKWWSLPQRQSRRSRSRSEMWSRCAENAELSRTFRMAGEPQYHTVRGFIICCTISTWRCWNPNQQAATERWRLNDREKWQPKRNLWSFSILKHQTSTKIPPFSMLLPFLRAHGCSPSLPFQENLLQDDLLKKILEEV